MALLEDGLTVMARVLNFVFTFPLAAFDRRRRALHDRLAGTTVVVEQPRSVWAMFALASVLRPGRVEVSAGGVPVIAAVALVVDVEAVDSRRNVGQVDVDVDRAVGPLGEVHRPFGGLVGRRRKGSRSHRTRRVARTSGHQHGGGKRQR